MKPLAADGFQGMQQQNAKTESSRSLAQQSAMDLLGLSKAFDSPTNSLPRARTTASGTDADFEAAYLLMTSEPLKPSGISSLGIPSAATPPNFDDLVRTRFSPQREAELYQFPTQPIGHTDQSHQLLAKNEAAPLHALSSIRVPQAGSSKNQHMIGPAQAVTPEPQASHIPASEAFQSYHTPPRVLQDATAMSTVSPNTRVLLNTFNNLNYSVSSKTAMNEWGASTPYNGDSSGYSAPHKPVQAPVQWTSHPAPINPARPSTELLSMTETSALESFLDSIASDVSFDKLAKQWSSIDPGSSASSLKEQMQNGVAAGISGNTAQSQNIGGNLDAAGRTLIQNGVVKDQSKQSLTDEEKKQSHTISEQKRRFMIRSSFVKLSELLDKSKFERTLQDRRKSKSKRKAMSKYNVLNRAVIEIELLQAQNAKLRNMCNEGGEM